VYPTNAKRCDSERWRSVVIGVDEDGGQNACEDADAQSVHANDAGYDSESDETSKEVNSLSSLVL